MLVTEKGQVISGDRKRLLASATAGTATIAP